jgi:hypothetical protein
LVKGNEFEFFKVSFLTFVGEIACFDLTLDVLLNQGFDLVGAASIDALLKEGLLHLFSQSLELSISLVLGIKSSCGLNCLCTDLGDAEK